VRRIAVAALGLLLLAGACKREKKPLSANLAVENKVTLRAVRLYFESPDMLLVAEQRNVALPENAAGAMSSVVRELFKGPANPSVPRLFPADTVVRAAYLLPEGTALIDLGGTTLSQGWGTGSHQELMAVYSVVQTVTANFPAAKQVRLLVNGGPAETLAGHVSLARSLQPKADLVDPRAR
jgi:hypothetical protein